MLPGDLRLVSGIFYLKVGREEKRDLEIVSAVRAEIGDARLRLDANEAWDPYMAIRMCRKFEPFDIDFIEQPTSSWSIEGLAHVRRVRRNSYRCGSSGIYVVRCA